MVNMQTNRSPLETEPLTKLLFRYSVPTTLTLMVNYIYNIVDQIFVGQGVGITGMAAINIAFPLSILVNAVSLLLGDGCAANVSLCLGRREQENANKIFGQAVTWIVASGIALAFICGIFAPHIVTLFGTTNTAYGESLAYMRVIAIGIPFQLICPAFTAMIRADGSPQYTMKCMMAGAVVNIILDPVFIFGLKMGVVGAGIATVIGEMAAGILCLLYLRRLQSVQLEKGALRPTWPVQENHGFTKKFAAQGLRRAANPCMIKRIRQLPPGMRRIQQCPIRDHGEKNQAGHGERLERGSGNVPEGIQDPEADQQRKHHVHPAELQHAAFRQHQAVGDFGDQRKQAQPHRIALLGARAPVAFHEEVAHRDGREVADVGEEFAQEGSGGQKDGRDVVEEHRQHGNELDGIAAEEPGFHGKGRLL